MAKTFPRLDKKHINFIQKQKIFFVATAPDDIENGFINLSPKGYDTLLVKDENTVIYADFPGSGNETATHIRQNKRLSMMFASFDKNPMILRLYGKGEVVSPDSPTGKELAERVQEKVSPNIRQLICLHIKLVKTSCGFGVPFYKYETDRNTLLECYKKKWV
tara:strand:+ start:1151 stop:1636 length:486 start_codon:yes stop_codon:yes gene_type:complete